jgi:hypothetical protein
MRCVCGENMGRETWMTQTYEALYVPAGKIDPDGRPGKSAWKQARLETQFTFPWEDRPAPRTEFRALYDERALYFAFRVEDDDVVLAEPYRTKQDVVCEDRVELFFALDERLAQYYCLEIDPLGRVLDYRASYYRKFDLSWNFPGLEAVGSRTDDGYAVEGRIPWTSLESLRFPPLDSGQPIKFGIYRAEFRHTNGPEWIESWISWVDPGTEEPDFHVPESFGYLKMVR